MLPRALEGAIKQVLTRAQRECTFLGVWEDVAEALLGDLPEESRDVSKGACKTTWSTLFLLFCTLPSRLKTAQNMQHASLGHGLVSEFGSVNGVPVFPNFATTSNGPMNSLVGLPAHREVSPGST